MVFSVTNEFPKLSFGRKKKCKMKELEIKSHYFVLLYTKRFRLSVEKYKNQKK